MNMKIFFTLCLLVVVFFGCAVGYQISTESYQNVNIQTSSSVVADVNCEGSMNANSCDAVAYSAARNLDAQTSTLNSANFRSNFSFGGIILVVFILVLIVIGAALALQKKNHG